MFCDAGDLVASAGDVAERAHSDRLTSPSWRAHNQSVTTHILLLGRTPFDPEAVRTDFSKPNVTFSTGTNLEEAVAAFDSAPVDMVIMGAGIPLSERLEIVKRVFELSESTTVHMKDRSSGKNGMVAFVNGVLGGLTGDSPS